MKMMFWKYLPVVIHRIAGMVAVAEGVRRLWPRVERLGVDRKKSN